MSAVLSSLFEVWQDGPIYQWFRPWNPDTQRYERIGE